MEVKTTHLPYVWADIMEAHNLGITLFQIRLREVKFLNLSNQKNNQHSEKFMTDILIDIYK